MSNRTLFTRIKYVFPIALLMSTFFMLVSCKEKRISHVVMNITTGADEPLTTNANPNSTILINGGDFHYVIKVTGKDKETAELTITKISYIGDTIKKKYKLKKYPATKQIISLNKPASIDGNAEISVTATSVVYQDNGSGADCIDCCTVKGCTAICCGSEFCVETDRAYNTCKKCFDAAVENCRHGDNVVRPPKLADFIDLYNESVSERTVDMLQ